MLFILLLFPFAALLSLLLLVRFAAAVFSLKSRNAILNRPIIHLALLIFVIFVWLFPWPSALGHFVAKYDISKGHYEIKMYGLQKGALAIYSRILKERFNVACPTSSCCAVMSSELEYSNAYNAVSMIEINKQYGRDLFTECEEAAQAERILPDAVKPSETLPQSEISESIQKRLESLSNSEKIKTLGELASDAGGNERKRFSALLLLGSFEDKSAVAALLENISLPDYSLPKKPATGVHPFTQDEYIRLGIVTRSERLIISTDNTPSVWALKKIGVFALPQIFEYMKTASVGNCQRSAKAVYLICGAQKEYNHFVKEYFPSLPEQAQRALASLGYSEYD